MTLGLKPFSPTDQESLINSVKLELRNLRIESIYNDNLFRLSDNVKRFENELFLIKKNFPDSIICGSLALNLVGILNREINDIDILIESDKKYKYNFYTTEYYDVDLFKNRLGNVVLYYKKNILLKKTEFLFDLYEDKNKNTKYLTFKYKNMEIKIQNPLDIIKIKLDICFKTKDVRNNDFFDFCDFLDFCK